MLAEIWAAALREAHAHLAGLAVVAAGDSTAGARVGIGTVDSFVFVAALEDGAIFEAGAGGFPVSAVAAVAGTEVVLGVLAEVLVGPV